MVSAGVRRLVNTGTGWQHFGGAEYNPVALYAATKQAFETMVRYYTGLHDLKVVHLRFFDTYGPLDPRPKLFQALRSAVEHGTKLEMAQGNKLINLVYVDEAIDAFLRAEVLLRGQSVPENRYSVIPSAPQTLWDVVETYFSVLGKEAPLAWGARPNRNREMLEPWNAGPIVPGWSAKISLREGIRRMENES